MSPSPADYFHLTSNKIVIGCCFVRFSISLTEGKMLIFCLFCHCVHISNMLCCQIAVLIYEPENTEAKQFFPLLEEKLLMERAQKLAEGESEDDEETIDGSSDGNKESPSCSNSSDEESEGSSDSDDSEKN
uniref:Uncharacterized protein n=1 Tax=Apteryx owenii TaxID=8824 RepID=A0A8B9NUS3_APTOW